MKITPFVTTWYYRVNKMAKSGKILLNLVLSIKTLTLWPFFMDGVQLSEGHRTTTRRQFTLPNVIIIWMLGCVYIAIDAEQAILNPF